MKYTFVGSKELLQSVSRLLNWSSRNLKFFPSHYESQTGLPMKCLWIWNEDYSYYSRKAVHNHIRNLCRKIKVASDALNYVKSICSIGYKFEIWEIPSWLETPWWYFLIFYTPRKSTLKMKWLLEGYFLCLPMQQSLEKYTDIWKVF